MRNYRFTITENDLLDLGSGLIVISNKELLHQINNVLRLNKDSKEEITFIDGSGRVYLAEILEINKKIAKFKIEDQHSNSRELSRKYIFLLPIIKIDAFNLMLRQLTELGVAEFYPVIFERTQKQNISNLINSIKKKRPQKIIEEAVEQCEGAVFPVFHDPCAFEQILKKFQAEKGLLKIFAFEQLAELDSYKNPNINELANDASTRNKIEKICLMVGVEGGFTDKEAASIEKAGFKAYSLGPRLLKAETAAVSLFSRLEALRTS